MRGEKFWESLFFTILLHYYYYLDPSFPLPPHSSKTRHAIPPPTTAAIPLAICALPAAPLAKTVAEDAGLGADRDRLVVVGSTLERMVETRVSWVVWPLVVLVCTSVVGMGIALVLVVLGAVAVVGALPPPPPPFVEGVGLTA